MPSRQLPTGLFYLTDFADERSPTSQQTLCFPVIFLEIDVFLRSGSGIRALHGVGNVGQGSIQHDWLDKRGISINGGDLRKPAFDLRHPLFKGLNDLTASASRVFAQSFQRSALGTNLIDGLMNFADAVSNFHGQLVLFVEIGLADMYSGVWFNFKRSRIVFPTDTEYISAKPISTNSTSWPWKFETASAKFIRPSMRFVPSAERWKLWAKTRLAEAVRSFNPLNKGCRRSKAGLRRSPPLIDMPRLSSQSCWMLPWPTLPTPWRARIPLPLRRNTSISRNMTGKHKVCWDVGDRSSAKSVR